MTGGFVRTARASDAARLAVVQVASWRATLSGLVPGEVLTELASEALLHQFEERWLAAITSPPTSRHRVHVAVEPAGGPAGGAAAPAPGPAQVAGFAAAGPATDEDLWAGTDGELYELHVAPELARQGHDERLLHAVADTFAEDGFRTAYTWALAGDEARIAFLASAGWAPDGSTSNLDMGVKVPIVRLHTTVSPAT